MNGFQYQHVLSKLREVRKRSWGWHAYCPHHEVGRGSHKHTLTVRIGDTGALLLKCHVGCKLGEICQSIGVELKDLFPRKDAAMAATTKSNAAKGNGKQQSSGLIRYDYHDENGEVLFRVVRSPQKAFWQEVYRDGRWQKGLGDTRRVLYHLPELIEADTSRKVLVVEGEKDVDNLRKLGFLATTNPMGGMKWTVDNDAELGYGRYLAGCDVIILGDNDPVSERLGYSPGMRHVDLVAEALKQWAKSIRKIYKLPHVGPKGDVSDWIANGGDKAGLIELIQNTPIWDGVEAHSYPDSEPAAKPSSQQPMASPAELAKRCGGKILELSESLEPAKWLGTARGLLDKFEELIRK